MKVLHLISSFGSGGAERQLSIIAPALAESGVECHVGYCYEGPNLKPLLGSSVHLQRIGVAGNHDPRLFWQVWSLIRAVKPDVVQTWLLQMDVVGGLAAVMLRVPFVVSERSSARNYPVGWKTQLRVAVGKRAQCVAANSQGGVDYWRTMASGLPVELIRNCISLKEAENSPGELALRSALTGRPMILFAGRLSHEKNVFVLIEALIEALHVYPFTTALIFGEGPFETELRSRVAKAGLSERIYFQGYSRSLSSWMKLADVCISTSWHEGNPNVVLEAAACGCPLVISDIPAHREVFDDNSVTFVRPDAPMEFASALVSVLRDKSLAKTKAARAQNIVAGFSQEKVVASYLSIYERIAVGV